MTQSTSHLLVCLLLALAMAPVHAGAQSADSVRLSLAEVARRALATHPSVELSVAEQNRAAAHVGEVRSARWPRMTTEWTGIHFQEPMIVAPLHRFDPRTPPHFDRSLVQGNVTIGYVLFDGGARGARIASAAALEESADAGATGAAANLLVNAAQLYLAVSSERELLGAQRARAVALEAELERVRRFETEGRAAHVEVLRAQAALARAYADRSANAARLAEREADLARLIGADVSAVQQAKLDLLSLKDSVQPGDRAALVERAVARNADVVRARGQVAAADAAARESRSARFPALSLGARYNTYGSGTGDFVGEWQSSVQLSYPLFTGGQRSSAMARADAERAVAVSTLRLSELAVAARVDHALSGFSEANARVSALLDAVAQFEAVVSVERLALETGAGVQTDYLTAESQLLESRAALSAARHARTLARVELARATGDLDATWLIANLENAT